MHICDRVSIIMGVFKKFLKKIIELSSNVIYYKRTR